MRLLCKLGFLIGGWIQKEIGSGHFRDMGIITLTYYLWWGLIVAAVIVIGVLINLLFKLC